MEEHPQHRLHLRIHDLHEIDPSEKPSGSLFASKERSESSSCPDTDDVKCRVRRLRLTLYNRNH